MTPTMFEANKLFASHASPLSEAWPPLFRPLEIVQLEALPIIYFLPARLRGTRKRSKTKGKLYTSLPHYDDLINSSALASEP